MLNSWKEIASYLDRGVRTVQRWERQLQLPVHRIGRGKRSPVCALVPELKFWLITSGLNHTSNHDSHGLALVRPGDGQKANSPIQMSRELISQSRQLVQNIAENTVRQQRQAELLRKRVEMLKSLRGVK
jgi:hypothetical protein